VVWRRWNKDANAPSRSSTSCQRLHLSHWDGGVSDGGEEAASADTTRNNSRRKRRAPRAGEWWKFLGGPSETAGVTVTEIRKPNREQQKSEITQEIEQAKQQEANDGLPEGPTAKT
jgi:hypothetical protein